MDLGNDKADKEESLKKVGSAQLTQVSRNSRPAQLAQLRKNCWPAQLSSAFFSNLQLWRTQSSLSEKKMSFQLFERAKLELSSAFSNEF